MFIHLKIICEDVKLKVTDVHAVFILVKHTLYYIYICTVSTNGTKRVYLGIAEGDWKQRFYNHKKSFKNKSYKNDTALSSFFMGTKRKHNEVPTLTWSIAKHIPGYSNVSKRCLLCLNEKLLITTYEHPQEILNKRSELMAKCRHGNKFLLSNYKITIDLTFNFILWKKCNTFVVFTWWSKNRETLSCK